MTTSSSGVDTRLYRDACACFATGVTVVTTSDTNGPRGLTANAVSSLSLDPTLFLVCVDVRAGSFEVLREAGHFAINILADDQEQVSTFFAVPTEEGTPMGEHGYHMSAEGSPLLDDALAWIDCRTHSILDGGDHQIFVGEVTSCEIVRPEAEPLLFFRGKYREIGPQ